MNPKSSVVFDGHVYRGKPPQEIFLEAKRGYEILETSPYLDKSLSMKQNLSKEIIRQVKALPDGARLEWHVSTERGATAIRNVVIESLERLRLDVDQVAVIATEQS